MKPRCLRNTLRFASPLRHDFGAVTERLHLRATNLFHFCSPFNHGEYEIQGFSDGEWSESLGEEVRSSPRQDGEDLPCLPHKGPHFFLHNLLNGDGIQSIAQFHKQALFDDYRISSQDDDRIAFTIDVSLLQRALRSSVSICSEFEGGNTANHLQIKLVKKLPPKCTQPMPFLTFETKGYKFAVIQDVPISKPLSRAEVLKLQTALEMA